MVTEKILIRAQSFLFQFPRDVSTSGPIEKEVPERPEIGIEGWFRGEKVIGFKFSLKRSQNLDGRVPLGIPEEKR